MHLVVNVLTLMQLSPGAVASGVQIASMLTSRSHYRTTGSVHGKEKRRPTLSKTGYKLAYLASQSMLHYTVR